MFNNLTGDFAGDVAVAFIFFCLKPFPNGMLLKHFEDSRMSLCIRLVTIVLRFLAG